MDFDIRDSISFSEEADSSIYKFPVIDEPDTITNEIYATPNTTIVVRCEPTPHV